MNKKEEKLRKKNSKEKSIKKDAKILNKKIKKPKIDRNENKNIKKNTIIEIDNKNINNYTTNPSDLNESIDLVEDSYIFDYLNNNDTFDLFESIDNIFYLVYSNNKKSIISFNIIENKKINEIKNAHDSFITHFRHCFDQANHRDLILSISSRDRNIKIWNINKIECILNLNNIYDTGYIYSACFLNYNGETFIITSNYKYGSQDDDDYIKVFNLKGDKIKDINDSKESIFFIDTYYDDKNDNFFIIITTNKYIKTYIYNINVLYHKYYKNIISKYKDSEYKYVLINNFTKTLKIIESTNNGNIRIWDFHSGRLLKNIKVSALKINGICLWNNEYLLACTDYFAIKIIKLKYNNYNYLFTQLNTLRTIKKFIHPKYGECLIVQGVDNHIRLYIKKQHNY